MKNIEVQELSGSYEFKMPKLGESITEAAIITWFKNVGDTVEKDEMLLEVATDKVDSEVPSTVSGVIEEILFEANDVIKIGQTIAIIKSDKKTAPPKSDKTGSADSVKKPDNYKTPASQIKPPKKLPVASQNNNTFFSPLIISIAKTHHISFEELARIPATGTGGRLRKSDVFKYIEDGRPFKFVQPPSHNDAAGFKIPKLNLDKGAR
jgi:2-oxoglutarate dehydrogenase E2 component (dihydrolipoamide succinyltransferase)